MLDMKIRTLPTLFTTGFAILALSACGSNSSSIGSLPAAGSTTATAGVTTPASTGSSAATTDSGTASSAATTTAAPKPSTLQILAGPGIKFDLAEYTTKAGVVHVVYTNRDGQRHTLAFVAADGKTVGKELEVVRSGDKAEGDLTLTTGSYKVICTVPGHNAMKATLTVG